MGDDGAGGDDSSSSGAGRALGKNAQPQFHLGVRLEAVQGPAQGGLFRTDGHIDTAERGPALARISVESSSALRALCRVTAIGRPGPPRGSAGRCAAINGRVLAADEPQAHDAIVHQVEGGGAGNAQGWSGRFSSSVPVPPL